VAPSAFPCGTVMVAPSVAAQLAKNSTVWRENGDR